MKATRTLILLTALFLMQFDSSSAYLQPSLRVRGLSPGLAGIMTDRETDIFLNPAYLGTLEKYEVFAEGAYDDQIYAGGVFPLVGNLNCLLSGVFEKYDYKTDRFSAVTRWIEWNEPYYTIYSTSSQSQPDKSWSGAGKVGLGITLSPKLSLGVDFSIRYGTESPKSWSNYERSIFTLVGDTLVSSYSSEDQDIEDADSTIYSLRGGAQILLDEGTRLDFLLRYSHFKTDDDHKDFSFYRYVDSLHHSSTESYYGHDDEFSREGNLIGGHLRFVKGTADLCHWQILLGVSRRSFDIYSSSWEKDFDYWIYNSTFNADSSWSATLDTIEVKSWLITTGAGLEKKVGNNFRLFTGVKCNLCFDDRKRWQNSLDSLKHVDNDTSYSSSDIRPGVLVEDKLEFFEVNLPFAMEFFPRKNLALRGGGQLTWKRSLVSPYRSSAMLKEETEFLRSFGFTYVLKNKLVFEGLSTTGDIFELRDWNLRVTYRF